MKKSIAILCVIATLFAAICFAVACNDIEYVDDEQHNYGEWIDAVPSTCVADGVIGHYHCTDCGKDFDQFFNRLDSVVEKTSGHTLVYNKAIPSTGVKQGSIEYYECSACGKCFADKTCATELDKSELATPIKVLSVSDLHKEANYLYQQKVTVRAVVAGASGNTDGGYCWYILKDEQTNDQIMLRNVSSKDYADGRTSSCIKGYSYAPNLVFPLGSIVEVPVVCKVNEKGQGGEKKKPYLLWNGDDYEDAIGYGTMKEWKAKYVVGTADDYAIKKDSVDVVIDSYKKLAVFLSQAGTFQNKTVCFEGTAENPLKFVTGAKAEGVGDINREYLYMYYGNASSLDQISFNGGTAVFSNFGNTFNMYSPLSCLLAGQTEYQDPNFSAPYEFVGKIYATCVGGNSSFYHFVVLSENDIINEGNTGSHAVISSKMAKNAFYKYMEQYAASIGIDIHGDITTAVGTTNVITTSDLCRIAIAGISCDMLQDIWCDLEYDTVITDKDGNPQEVHAINKVLANENCQKYIAPYYTIVGTKSGSLNYTNKYRGYINNVLMVVEGPGDTYIAAAVCNEGEDAAEYTYPNLKRLFDILWKKYNGEDTSQLEKEMDCDYCAGVVIPKEGCEPNGYDWFADDSKYVHFTKDAEVQITTASCWKTMTAITCLSYITEEQLQTPVYVGTTELNSIASLPKFVGGEVCTLEDALHFMMLLSSNVAPNVIARGVGELIIRAQLAQTA